MTRFPRLSAALPWMLLLFVAAAFVLPSEPAYALVFYVAVLPALAARYLQGPRPDPRAPGFTALALVPSLALVAWSGLTLLWGQDDGHRSLRFLSDTLATGCFVLAMAATLPDAALRRRVGTVLIVLGGANAAFAIAVNIITHPAYPRLRGWGASSHPILGAAVMAVAYLTALARGLQGRRRWGTLGAAAIMALFIVLTESRGPLLAAGIATVFLCAAGAWRWRALGVLGTLAALWWALPATVKHHSAKVLESRGSSHRFEIWQYTAGLIADRPWFGHGLAANLHLDVGDVITFPHDLYLSLLFYSGGVGLALFATLAIALTWGLLRAWATAEFPWLMALWLNLLVTGLTDLGQITKGPGPLWFIVWLPVGLIAAACPALQPTRRAAAPRLPD